MRYEPAMLKQMNESRVLNLLRMRGRLSKTDISKYLELALPTTLRIIDSLSQQSYIRDAGLGSSTGGRPPSIVAIDGEHLCVIGLELGRRWVRVVRANLLSEILDSDYTKTENVDDPDKLMSFVKDFIKQIAVSNDLILGIGIAAPGPLDANQGVILTPNGVPEGWKHFAIKQRLTSEIGLKCYLENNADAAAISEVWSSNTNSLDSLMFVLGEVGLGIGMVLNGQVWRGHSNTSGDLGHVVVDINGKRCTCGKLGCVDMYGSASAIEASARDVCGKTMAYQEVIEKVNLGSRAEREILEEALRYLVEGVLNAAIVLNPKRIVVGGQFLTDVAKGVPDLFESALSQLSLASGADVTVSTHGIHAVALGAATLILQDVYDHRMFIM